MNSTFREIFSDAVAIAALLVSFFALYYSERVVDSSFVKLADFDTTHDEKIAKAKLVFFNSGNVSNFISAVRFVTKGEGESGYSYPADDSSLSKAAPFVLSKDGVVVIEYDFPLAGIGTTAGDAAVYFGALIELVDSKGALFHTEVWLAANCAGSGYVYDGDYLVGVATLRKDNKSVLRVKPCD